MRASIVDTASGSSSGLAIAGATPTIADSSQHDELFHWPIVTTEDEQAVLDVLRSAKMSAWDITMKFEAEFAAWHGLRHGLAYPNGTMALQAAMYAIGLRRGHELICPSLTYWASALQAFSLGATIVFADVEPDSLCLDPDDIERHISPRTKAIMAVHYCGHPCRMDAIVVVARRHGLKVIEDVSHAQGGMYQGKMLGTFGDVAAMSLMTLKSFAIGEGGILVTDSSEVFEHSLAFSHYERTLGELTIPELRRVVAPDGFSTGLPLGAVKGRMNQTCSAMARVQLKYYPERIAEIQRAMNRFWDILEGTPGIRPHRVAANSGSTMGGWYNPLAHYVPEEMHGVPVQRFVEALNAEGARPARGLNFPLHLHPLLNEADIYGDGKPTRIAFSDRDLRQPRGSLPVSEAAGQRGFGVPSFKHDRPELIEGYAAAYRKVAQQSRLLRG